MLHMILYALDPEYEANCQQAIYWLIQSSMEGYMLAIEKLKECFENGKGIVDD